MKISNAQLSEVSGIKRALLSLILSGKTPISDDSAEKFARITGMSKNYWKTATPSEVRRLLEVEFWCNKAVTEYRDTN